jgi:hypothetical protein
MSIFNSWKKKTKKKKTHRRLPVKKQFKKGQNKYPYYKRMRMREHLLEI